MLASEANQHSALAAAAAQAWCRLAAATARSSIQDRVPAAQRERQRRAAETHRQGKRFRFISEVTGNWYRTGVAHARLRCPRFSSQVRGQHAGRPGCGAHGERTLSPRGEGRAFTRAHEFPGSQAKNSSLGCHVPSSCARGSVTIGRIRPGQSIGVMGPSSETWKRGESTGPTAQTDWGTGLVHARCQ